MYKRSMLIGVAVKQFVCLKVCCTKEQKTLVTEHVHGGSSLLTIFGDNALVYSRELSSVSLRIKCNHNAKEDL